MSLVKKEFPPKYLAVIRKLRLIDDTFFAACFDGDIDCMNLLLCRVFHRDDIKVTSVVTQRSAQNLYGRGVRFDVLAIDSEGRIYNCEIQRADAGAIPRRARYNGSMLDSREIAKNTEFKDFPETYVIFITEKDIFQAGLPIYHVERKIEELGNRNFDDGLHIIYVNSECRDETPLGQLMQDFFETDAKKMHNKELAKRVDYFKSEDQGVASMCEIIEQFGRREKADGIAIGERKKAREMAANMLDLDNVSIDDIAKVSGLSTEEIKSLAKQKSA